jgi:hypothetical protein
MLYILKFGLRKLTADLRTFISSFKSAIPGPHAPTKHHDDPMPNQRSTNLDIPQMPDELDQHEYPDVPFWQRAEWTTKEKESISETKKFDFLTDDLGQVVSSGRLKEMSEAAKEVWIELYSNRMDPESWGKKGRLPAKYFNSVMKNAFPEFCYCDGNWKVEMFGTLKHPDWKKNCRKPGNLTRTVL